MRTWLHLHRSAARRAWLFWLVFALGLSVHVAGAFHGNIWFDESYSVALARHPLPELVRMAATDVHPPAYYLMLRLVALLSGGSITAERLFSVAGACALAALGWTHVRRDLGLPTATCYCALVLFAPWTATEAIDIRMYAWAACFVMLSWIYIARAIRTLRSGAQPHLRVWVAAFGWALAAAYTHYIAAMAAACGMLLLLVACLAQVLLGTRRGVATHASFASDATPPKAKRVGSGVRWRALGIFVTGALVDFVAYLPWFGIMRTQKAAVQKSFWITLNWPDDYLRLYKFPWFSDEVEELSRGLAGAGFGIAVRVAMAAVLVLALFALVRALAIVVRFRLTASRSTVFSEAAPDNADFCKSDLVLWGFGGLFVLWGCLAMAIFAGRAMGQPIIMPRYLFVALGPQMLGLSVLLCAPVRSASCQLAASANPMACYQHATGAQSVAGHRVLPVALCILTAALGIATAGLAATRNYAPANQAPVEFYRANAQVEGQIVPVVAGYPVWNNVLAAGPLAELEPDIPQIMEDTIPAYCAYSPQATLVASAPKAPEIAHYHGKLLFISYAKNDGPIFQFASEAGAHILSINHFERPYKTEDWCIAILERP